MALPCTIASLCLTSRGGECDGKGRPSDLMPSLLRICPATQGIGQGGGKL